MTTIVSFELAKLLKEKGFDKPSNYFYEDKECIQAFYFRNHNESSVSIVTAPFVFNVITWLYEKHGIHIFVLPQDKGVVDFRVEGSDYPSLPLFLLIVKYNKDFSFEEVLNTSDPKNMLHFDTFEEAYNYAIKYALNNLI